MEKNISKRLFAGVCALSAAFILAACDPISAVPSNYDDPIVLDKDGNGIVDDENKVGKIYDAVATDRNTTIVSNLLEEVANGKFGSYSKVKEAYEAHIGGDDTLALALMSEHQDVFYRDGDADIEGKTENEVRLHRFEEFYKDIKNRISEFFYNEITSGSYNDDEGRFDESKLWWAHYYEFYDVLDLPDGGKWAKFFVTDKVTKENALDMLNDLYSNPDTEKRGYIEEKVYPQILKDKLVEEYVFNNNSESLGRAYARKVNYIKVAYDENDDTKEWSLLKSFADSQITSVTSDGKVHFDIISKAIKGYDTVGTFASEGKGIIDFADDACEEDGKAALDLLKATLGDYNDKNSITIDASHESHYKLDGVTLVRPGKYYKDTKLGELLVSYEKAIRAELSGRFPLPEEKAELDKFTSSAKSKVHGLRDKLISLAKEDYTTDGWYVKNGGLSELPSGIRDRLFNINVANTLDNGSLKYEDGTLAPGADPVEVDGVKHYSLGAYEKDDDGKAVKRIPYMRNINGNKFVIPAKSLAFKDNEYNFIYNDTSGHAFYIVLVEEAPSTAKLTLSSESSYSKLAETKDDVFKTEDVSRAVAKVLGTKDSYIKDAYTEILKKYEFVFYETSLYEHFKSEYPDLFEDEE